jgi:PKD repeat protein
MPNPQSMMSRRIRRRSAGQSVVYDRGRSNVAIRLLRTVKRHRARLSRGQSLVEFAIVLPVMLFLLLIVVDFGRIFASYIEISNASREGAAYAAGTPGNATGIHAQAVSEMNSQNQAGQGALTVTETCANSAGNSINCTSAGGGSGTGNTITVTATERFTFLTPLISFFFGGGVTLNASTTAAVAEFASSGGQAPKNCTEPPIAEFTPPTVFGRTVTLDASLSSPSTGVCAISGYNWDMGDGASPNPPIVDRNATYTFTRDGTFRITLEVTNPAGTSQPAWLDVQIGIPGPSASPSATPTPAPTRTSSPTTAPPVCSTAPTFTSAFTGNGNGTKRHQMTFYGAYTGKPDPASWSWNFGDNGSSSGQNTSHDYTNPGTYTVRLTVTNGSCVQSVTISVVVR